MSNFLTVVAATTAPEQPLQVSGRVSYLSERNNRITDRAFNEGVSIQNSSSTEQDEMNMLSRRCACEIALDPGPRVCHDSCHYYS